MVVAMWQRRKRPPGGPLGTTLRAYSEGITGQAEDPPPFLDVQWTYPSHVWG